MERHDLVVGAPFVCSPGVILLFRDVVHCSTVYVPAIFCSMPKLPVNCIVSYDAHT